MYPTQRRTSVLAACAAGLSAFITAGAAAGDNDDPIPTHREPFALVELFTSEGCHSCPPAEAVLNRMNRQARADGTRVFTLAFHVDYWNRLGWVDPFSDAAYTERQRGYGRDFRLRSIYTPQMIVNGTTEFVGSRGARAELEVATALQPANPPEAPGAPELGVGVRVVGEPVSGEAVTLRWRVDRLPPRSTFVLAVTEDGLVTDVPRGENRGKTLHHDGVVRAFTGQPLLDLDGTTSLELPEDLDVANASAVVFVQSNTDRRVLAAHRVPLTKSSQ